MADSKRRKNATVSRLKAKLRKSKESLADDFEFKMFVIITFKNEVCVNLIFSLRKKGQVDKFFRIYANNTGSDFRISFFTIDA